MMLSFGLESDMQVELIRHISTLLVVQSAKSGLRISLELASHTDRDIVALLLRHFIRKFSESPDEVREES